MENNFDKASLLLWNLIKNLQMLSFIILLLECIS